MVDLVSKRNQIRSVLCFECRCRLNISTLEKWLDHVQYSCAMRPVLKPETLNGLNTGEGVNNYQKTRRKNVQ